MARFNKIEKLSPLSREILEDAIRDAGYRNYDQLARKFGGVGALGMRRLSRSTIAAFGKRLRDQDQKARAEASILGDPHAAPVRLFRWAQAHPEEAEKLMRRLATAS